MSKYRLKYNCDKGGHEFIVEECPYCHIAELEAQIKHQRECTLSARRGEDKHWATIQKKDATIKALEKFAQDVMKIYAPTHQLHQWARDALQEKKV